MSIKSIIIALVTPTIILIPLIVIAGVLATYHNYRIA